MERIKIIDKVSRIDSVDDLLIVGIDSKAVEGVMASNGDTLSILREGEKVEDYSLNYFYFLSHNDGVIFYENEGDPIFYFDFKNKKQITGRDNYFNPLQSRNNKSRCIITEMDENYNQKFKLLDVDMAVRDLPKFPKILLEDSFIYFDRSKVEKFSLSNFELEWEIEIDPEDQVERRNQGGAVFSDGENVYVRLKGGRLTCLTLSEGKKLWEFTNEIDQVSFSEYGDFVYIHKGDGLIEVEKSSGRNVRNLNFRDVEGLEDFSSNGIIWCFEKILVVRNSFTGDLAVFNRGTFELIYREVVDKAGIPESRDCIKFLNNYLYVLSTSSRLHAYKIDLIGQTA